MNTPSPLLVILSAPSGAGKTTLCAKLLKEFPESLRLSISCTTRAPRGSEKHGTEYFFLPRPEFERKIAKGEFAEWAEVHGNLYGTLRSTIEDFFAKGFSVLLDIDVQGAESLRRAFPGRCASLFIAPPSLEALEARLRARGTETGASIRRRLENARAEMKRANEFDRVVVNDELDRAFREVLDFAGAFLGKKA